MSSDVTGRSSDANRMSGDVTVRSNGADRVFGDTTGRSSKVNRMSGDLTMRPRGTERVSGDMTVRFRGDVPEVGHHGENTLPDDVCYIREGRNISRPYSVTQNVTSGNRAGPIAAAEAWSDTCRSVTPPKKRELVKKENKKNKPKTPELPLEQTEDGPSSNHVSKATTPQPSEEFHSPREASLIQEPSAPELPSIESPELREIPEKKRYQSKVVKEEMKLVEVMPELPPEKKKLPPPPKIQPSYNPSPASWRSKVEEAPSPFRKCNSCMTYWTSWQNTASSTQTDCHTASVCFTGWSTSSLRDTLSSHIPGPVGIW
ncbi:hypothetical protein DPMN_111267 [Dreissena polymorpha]|uniref:Uncharacterized protein n=1 Tax=Dreissena polymorpha TaxID=45954 RepID=A0A9D4KE49_DREPO|nr:hypothetical protein DPMN_111267 [Dreissena polymorpha]